MAQVLLPAKRTIGSLEPKPEILTWQRSCKHPRHPRAKGQRCGRASWFPPPARGEVACILGVSPRLAWAAEDSLGKILRHQDKSREVRWRIFHPFMLYLNNVIFMNYQTKLHVKPLRIAPMDSHIEDTPT